MNVYPRALTVLLVCATTFVSAVAHGQTPGRQDPLVVRQAVEQFLMRQATGLPGEVTIEIGQLDTRLAIPACLQPEPFMVHGSRLWGKTSVGVRCVAPSPWTVYVTANVHVMAEYVVAAAPLSQGHTVTPSDIARLRGDLSMLPAGVLTDPALAVGRTTMSSVQLGAPLRQDTLRTQQAVQMGQTIRLRSSGPGFSVSTEARALNSAAEGQTVQAKTPNGQFISGIAKAGGVLEVAY
ncbi:MAG: flagellar basal body P-ring formation chaperone FlgA [Burkholderiaceae bacterium]